MTEPVDGAERTDPSGDADGADEAPQSVTVAAVAESDVLRLAGRLDPLDVVLDGAPTGRRNEPVPVTVVGDWADPATIWAIVDRRLTLDDCRPPRLALSPPPSSDVDDRIDMYTSFDLFRPAPADVVDKLVAGSAIAL